MKARDLIADEEWSFEVHGDDPDFWEKVRAQLGDDFKLMVDGELYEITFTEGLDEPHVRLVAAAQA